jgi:hypothetical protein
VFRIVRDEGLGLYRGWGWTAARNAPGSFAVGLIHSQIVHITNNRDSSSVVLPSPRDISSGSRTITRRHGSKIS